MTASLAPHVRQMGGLSHLDLIIEGARCGGCLAKIERGVGELAGVRQARMNLSTSRLHVAWEGGAELAETVAQTLKTLGFGSGPLEADAVTGAEKTESRKLLLCMAVAAFGLMNVMMLSVAVWSGGADMSSAERTLLHMISAAIALPVAAFSGRPFFTSAWKALRSKQGNMDVPISLAILLACGLSIYETAAGQEHAYFDAVLMLIFLLLVGRFLDARLRAKTGRTAKDLAALQAVDALMVGPKGEITQIPAQSVQPGDRLSLPVGARIPVDVKILSGTSQIDSSIVTGESAPITVAPGDTLYSGCLNLGQPLMVEAIRVADDSFLSEISELVEAGQQSQARYVRLADRAARAYVPIVHTLAALTFLGWMIVGAEPRTAIINAIAVLIITCPCALGLAVPAVQVVAVGKLFSQGIVVKSGDALERLAQVTQVVFDKTGTLTHGATALATDAVYPEDLSLFATLARHSTHPAALPLRQIESEWTAQDVLETAGQGVSGIIDGDVVRIGQIRFVQPGAQDAPGLWGRVGDRPPVSLSTTETLRPEALQTVVSLKKLGLTPSLLSGDSQIRAEEIAEQLSISDWQGRVRPGDKSDVVKAFQASGEHVLMVGDGINDAPALAHAHASAALASGTDISRSASDIVLRGDSLAGLPFAIRMARAARQAVVQNFGFTAVYNILAVPLAVFGFVTPFIAAVAMSLSSIIVTLNALRLNRIQPSKEI